MLKKFPLNKINGTKNTFFFLSRAPTHHSFTFNLRFLYEVKLKVRLSKGMRRIFHFQFISFSTRSMDSLTLKRHIPFRTKILEKPHKFLLSDL